MATHTINISNSFSVLGISPATRWDIALWDGSLWENTEVLPFSMIKGIKNTFVFSSSQKKNPTKKIDDYFTVLSSQKKNITKKNTDSFAISQAIDDVEKKNGDWSLINPGGTTNILDQVQTSFTTQTYSETSYTSGTNPTTVWSEV